MPFEEMNISLKSRYPELATAYLQTLVKLAHLNALTDFSNDVRALKASKIRDVQEKLNSLSMAGERARVAEIARLQEKNQELIDSLQVEIDSMLAKARIDRDNRITQLGEALQTAARLEIRDPLSWESFSSRQKSDQIKSELEIEAKDPPLFFRGTRLLQGELDQLKARENDKPFVEGISKLELEIYKLKNDSKLAALKSRANDTIYIEGYDDLQRELTNLESQIVEFVDARMSVISQPALVPTSPVNSPMNYIVLGTVASGFFALLVAIISISLRNNTARPVGPL